MRTLAEVKSKFANPDHPERVKLEETIDARIDLWGGIGEIRVPYPSDMPPVMVQAIADNYRKAGGFRVETTKAKSDGRNGTDLGEFILTEPPSSDDR